MNDPVEVLITVSLPGEIITHLKGISDRLSIFAVEATSPDEIPPERWATIDVLYTNYVLPEPEQAPNLDWIQFHWAGIDHVVEEQILEKPDLIVTTMSGASATQMAEHVICMFLALGRKLTRIIENQTLSNWPKDRWKKFSPVELRDSTVGIVGYGSVGRQVARLLHPFGAKVLATKRDVKHPGDKGFVEDGFGDPNGDYVHRLYPSEALRSMVKECDYLLVCVPLAFRTRNLIDEDVLSAMKPTAYLVDVSRGGVIQPDALISALKENQIAGAALDVFTQEPLPKNNPLWKMPNVIITPHISGSTKYYDERAGTIFAENLSRFLEGQQLYNLFNKDLGY